MGAKSEPPKDKREYIRLSVDLPEHPKLVQLDEEIIPLAGWLLVTAFAYCGKNLTDGEFVPGVIYRKACVDSEIGKHLIAAGLWHEAGHDCPKCPQPGDRKLISHDYLEHQRSKEEAQALRSARSDAGMKGAEKRWAAKRAAEAAKIPNPRPPMASAIASATPGATSSVMANAWQDGGKPMTEEEVEEEQLLLVPDSDDASPPASSVTAEAVTDEKTKRKPKPEPPRGDVDHLCRLLDQLMTENGSTRHRVNEDWKREARLLLDKDKVPLTQAIKVLRWSQEDKFWKTNILSMPTFREKWEQLRLKRDAAVEEEEREATKASNRRSVGRPGVPEGW